MDIELVDEGGGRCRAICLDDVFNVQQNVLDLFFRRFNEQLCFVLSHIKTEKIKPVVNEGDSCFVLGQFETAQREEFDDQRFDLIFENLFCCSGDDKVVSVSDKMNFMLSAKIGF